MPESSGRSKARSGVSAFSIPAGTELVEYHVRRSEKEIERRRRLRQEFWSFLVKDLLGYLVAFLIVIASAVCCLWVLMRPDALVDERRWAITILSSILTAVVGFAFGKATK